MVKLDIEDLRFILALDRLGSLAALAREENVTPPAITKRLNHLENRLGTRVALRTTRRLQLTHEGHLLVQHAAAVIDRMQAIEEALRERSQVVAGRLKVHGPFGFGRRYLAPLLERFRNEHPNVDVQLYLSDSLVLPRQPVHGPDAFDVVVSIGQMPDSRWVAHPVAPNRRILCAAPSYLARAPVLQTPADLAGHACLVLRENDEDVTLWRFGGPDRGRGRGRLRAEDGAGSGAAAAAREATVRVHPVMESNDGETIHQWCLAGKGVMIRSEWDVADSLARGRLIALLPRHRLADANVVALLPASRVASARARLFIDLLRRTFRPKPPWRA